ncbi:uncharacterized protein K452DRAFT_302881 [Aplosporella prunicola CBS 121167]|uniref:Uncharacterized protein n=1 Tax=Aplosporella prunicola CBS 121167 TaxID=1176127 RepID=A0A6A6AWH3_9PEZI|nr:uncharacterized protein K452DRAFT_302881 [Aplosporella prunicola CBS 121167]KAF2136289.1 hypothetical protein K452DRAFT_302881 [Aplosporella prunicola CBS 121167]
MPAIRLRPSVQTHNPFASTWSLSPDNSNTDPQPPNQIQPPGPLITAMVGIAVILSALALIMFVVLMAMIALRAQRESRDWEWLFEGVDELDAEDVDDVLLGAEATERTSLLAECKRPLVPAKKCNFGRPNRAKSAWKERCSFVPLQSIDEEVEAVE